MSMWTSSVPTEEFIPGIYAQILTAFLHISKNQRQVSFETQEKTENMSRYPTLSRNCLEQNIPLLVHDWQVCSYKRSILWYCLLQQLKYEYCCGYNMCPIVLRMRLPTWFRTCRQPPLGGIATCISESFFRPNNGHDFFVLCRMHSNGN